MAAVVAVTVCFVIVAGTITVVSSSAAFFLKLHHYENYHNLLKNEARCDSGISPCDPAFEVYTRGSWGSWVNRSSCIANKNELKFGDRVGDSLSNPILFQESSIAGVTIEVKVKDCLMNSPMDDIGDFYAELTDMPQPFFFTDRLNLEDGDRVRTKDLTPMRDTPITIRLQVKFWRRCNQFYFGHDCSKFCRPIPGHTCHPDTGRLVCAGPACSADPLPPPTQPPPPPQPQQSQRPPRPASAGPPAAAPPVAPASAPAAGPAPGTRSGSGDQQLSAVNASLIAVMSAILILIGLLMAGALIFIRRCNSRAPKLRLRGPNQSLIPPTHSMAVGLRDLRQDNPAAESGQTDAMSNPAYAYSVQLRQPLVTATIDGGGAGGRGSRQEESSGIYDEPQIPDSRGDLPLPPPPPSPLPPLPARTELPRLRPLSPAPSQPLPPPQPPTSPPAAPQSAPLPPQFSASPQQQQQQQQQQHAAFQRTPMSRSFSKANNK